MLRLALKLTGGIVSELVVDAYGAAGVPTSGPAATTDGLFAPGGLSAGAMGTMPADGGLFVGTTGNDVLSGFAAGRRSDGR